MKTKGVDHIGVAVKDLRETSDFYRNQLGLEVSEIHDLPSQKLRIAYVNTGATRLELLEPTSEDSVIAKFIQKSGEGIHHICLIVEDIEGSLAELKSKGVRLIDEKPRVNAHGEKIAFIDPKSSRRVLTELKEKKNDWRQSI